MRDLVDALPTEHAGGSAGSHLGVDSAMRVQPAQPLSRAAQRAVARAVTDPRVPARPNRAPRLPRSVTERLGPQAAPPSTAISVSEAAAVAIAPATRETAPVTLAPSVPTPATESALEILASASATAVTRRTPVGSAQTFGRERVFAWVKVRNPGEPSTIQMVWKHEGIEKGVVTLNVGKSPRWRTWSRRQMRARDTGNWSVEVQTAQGDVLDRIEFHVDARRGASMQSAQR